MKHKHKQILIDLIIRLSEKCQPDSNILSRCFKVDQVYQKLLLF